MDEDAGRIPLALAGKRPGRNLRVRCNGGFERIPRIDGFQKGADLPGGQGRTIGTLQTRAGERKSEGKDRKFSESGL